MLELKIPNQRLLKKVKKGIDEIKNNPSEFDIFAVKRFLTVPDSDFKAYFKELTKERKGIDLKEGFAPQSVFWLFDEDVFIGFFVLRHRITDQMLKNCIGHIGYEIIPSCRRQGYAIKGLHLLLDHAKNIIGLNEVIISCLENNTSSYRTMIRLMREYGGQEMEMIRVNHKRKKMCLIRI